MNLREIDQIRKTVARGYGAEQRASYYHWLGKDTFPEWYLKEIHRLSAKYRPIRYLPLDVPKFEINKKEFLDWWDNEAIDIVRTAPDAAEPWSKEAHPLGKASSWYRPQFKGVDIYFDDPPNFERNRALGWTNKLKPHPMFDRIIEQIRDTMPFYHIRSIYLWESLRPVAPHRDSDYFWDLPLMFRIMLNDENDPVTEPTLYVADVDHGDAHYVKLPEDTNTFVWSNGSQLHGSDFHEKRKHLICINHAIDISKYEALLDRSIEKYKNKLNYKLKFHKDKQHVR